MLKWEIIFFHMINQKLLYHLKKNKKKINNLKMKKYYIITKLNYENHSFTCYQIK